MCECMLSLSWGRRCISFTLFVVMRRMAESGCLLLQPAALLITINVLIY